MTQSAIKITICPGLKWSILCRALTQFSLEWNFRETENKKQDIFDKRKKENLVYLTIYINETRRDATTSHIVDGAAYFRFQWPINLANYPSRHASVCLSVDMCGMPITKLMCGICCHFFFFCFYRNEQQQQKETKLKAKLALVFDFYAIFRWNSVCTNNAHTTYYIICICSFLISLCSPGDVLETKYFLITINAGYALF